MKTKNDLVTEDWSPDGKSFLYGEIDPKPQTDLWILPGVSTTGEPARPTAFVRTEFDENFARFSPDGKWVAYQSNESGRYEIYVRPFHPEGAGAGSGRSPPPAASNQDGRERAPRFSTSGLTICSWP